MNWREINRRYEAGVWAVPLALLPVFLLSALFGQPSAIEPVVELFFLYTPISLSNLALNLLGPAARPLAIVGAIALLMVLGGLIAIAAPATYEPKPFLLKSRFRWLFLTAAAFGGGLLLAKAAATPISALAALLASLLFVPMLRWTRTWRRPAPQPMGRRKVLRSMLGTPLIAFSLLTLSTYELWSTLAIQVFSLGNPVRQLFPFVTPSHGKQIFPSMAWSQK